MIRKFKPKTMHLSGKGFGKVLGELEAKVMELVWDSQSVTARYVTDELAKQKRSLSFNSVMTILNRLADKKILKKASQNNVCVFIPLITRQDFSRLVTRDILTELVNDPTLFSSAHFNDLASDLDAATLAKLRQFVKKTES